ncbi:MAG: hypothetical protein ACLFPL_04445 [Candidatus Nanoarchaeia archaeon]
MSNENNNSIQLLISVFISILVLLLFIFSYSEQSSTDVSTFQYCINDKNCVLQLAIVSNSSELCESAQNSSSCTIQYVLKSKRYEACNMLFNESEKLSCIVSLSIQERENYCQDFYNSTSTNQTNLERCEFSFDYYFNESEEE